MNEPVQPTEDEWTFYDCGWMDSGERDAGIVSKAGYSVARCPRYTTREQWQADAKLIIQSKKMASLLYNLIHTVDCGPYFEEAIALLKETGLYVE